jgi:CspA family cold shock protein
MFGTVKWFDSKKGFGFIACEAKHPDVFVHHTAIEGKGYRVLNEMDHVEFEVEAGDRGPKAANVRVIERGTPRPRHAHSP